MDSVEKVYTQTVIDDTPFPQDGVEGFDSSQSTTSGNYSAETIKDNPMPVKRTAVELISSALNTKSKKILQTFELTQSGGIQIGKYEEGVTGDLRMTPAGIAARNPSGETTFALDAETGDAVFKGTVSAGSFIGADGNFVVEQGQNGARIVLYNNGLPSILIGDPT